MTAHIAPALIAVALACGFALLTIAERATQLELAQLRAEVGAARVCEL